MVVLISIAVILTISAKLANLDLLKTNKFQNKSKGVIVYAHEITKKVLSRDSNYTVDVVM